MAIVIDDGEHRVGIAALDAIGFFHDDVLAVRRAIGGGARLDYVIVASTHNHSTPDLMGIWGPSEFRSGYDPAYRRQVVTAAAAIETGVAGPDTVYEDAGELTVAGHTLIEQNRPNPEQTMWTLREALAWSLNVVFAQVGLVLPDPAEQLLDRARPRDLDRVVVAVVQGEARDHGQRDQHDDDEDRDPDGAGPPAGLGLAHPARAL